MKRIKTILATSILASSLLLPAANVSAAGDVNYLMSYVDGSSIHIEGEASSGTVAVAIEVYNADKSVKLAGPETIDTDPDDFWKFSYDLSGNYNTNTTYTVCAADFMGGEETCRETLTAVKTVNIKIKNPKVGDTITLREVHVDLGGGIGYDTHIPNKRPIVTISSNQYELMDEDVRQWVKGTCTNGSLDCETLFEGTFKKDKYYYAMLDVVTSADTIIFARDVVVKVNGKAITDFNRWENGYGLNLYPKLKATANGESEDVAAGDTGTAPKGSEYHDKVVETFSLATSVAVASAIFVAGALFVKKKHEA